MPWEMVRNSDGSYRVQKKGDSSDVRMKHGSKEDAKKQLRLLYGLEHGLRRRKRV